MSFTNVKNEFTAEDNRKMLELLQGAPNTGHLQGMLLSGGPVTEADMTALITKLRELETAKPLQDLKNAFDGSPLGNVLSELKNPLPQVVDTLLDLQLTQMILLQGSNAANMVHDFFGPDIDLPEPELALSSTEQEPPKQDNEFDLLELEQNGLNKAPAFKPGSLV